MNLKNQSKSSVGVEVKSNTDELQDEVGLRAEQQA
jgi:hypothetical protein